MFAPNKVTLGCIVMVKLIYVQNLDIVNNVTAEKLQQYLCLSFMTIVEDETKLITIKSFRM
jgi:hypothetical protein